MHASVNGIRIFFDVDGAGVRYDGETEVETPVMLLLPGGPAASHTHYKAPRAGFGFLRDALQLVYVDWRGAWRSDPAPPETLTLANAVADVEAIRELLGIERWIVLGASAGGIWSLAYAAAHPERVTHLVVLHSPARCDQFADTAETIARRAGVTDPEALRIYRGFVGGTLDGPVAEWAMTLRNTIVQTQNATYADPEKHPELAERRTRNWNAMPPDTLMRELDVSRWYLRDFRTSFRVADIGHRIACPTLIGTGETDPVAPPSQSEEIHRAIAGSELFVHPGGHMPHGDEQEPFFARITDFLRRHGVEMPDARPDHGSGT
jgi:proline iminopeptidase